MVPALTKGGRGTIQVRIRNRVPRLGGAGNFFAGSGLMQSFRFVHAADLHLDAPFRGLSLDSKDMGNALSRATFDAFADLIHLCLEKEADFLLVSGDVYNQEKSSLRAHLAFRDGLAELAAHNICVYVVHGNHDPVGSFSRAVDWPENTHIFNSDEPESIPFSREGEVLALIHGASHMRSKETRNLAERFVRDPREVFQIGLLHCNVGRNTGHEPYAPCDLRDLTGTGLDYWALGHVHTRGVWSENPHVVYPGNIQGLNVNETGPRGCFVVDVGEDGAAEPVFHALDKFRWACVRADIRDITTLDRLEEKILGLIEAEQCEAGKRGLVCRVVLSGRGALHHYLSEDGSREDFLQRLREQLSGFDPLVWIKDLVPDTAPEIDLEARRDRHDFLGEVLSRAEEVKSREDKLEFLQKEVFFDLFGHRRAGKYLRELDLNEAEELLRRAELLAADRLEPGEE